MTAPVLSVVLAGYDLEETRAVRSSFGRQTIAPQIELILVLPADASAGGPELFDAFHSGRIVRVDRIASRGRANATGVRAAKAPIVALAEDHAFPAPDWAEALVSEHRPDRAVVAPRVTNANPATATSWADYVIAYGPWTPATPGGERPLLPGHNSSYKLTDLLDLGDGLEAALDAETLLHWELTARGRQLWLSDRALIHHVNFSRLSAFLRAQLIHGRNFAGLRAASWGPAKRLLYAFGSPLIPLVRAWRLRSAYHPDGTAAPWSSLPMFLLGLAVDGLGQGLGYAFGRGDHEEELTECEFARVRYVTAADRRMIADRAAAFE